MPTSGVVPALDGYPSVRGLQIEVDETTYDVLAYDPAGARKLLAKAGVRSPRVDILYPNHPASQDVPLILRQQWTDNLDAEVVLVTQEQKVWHQNRNALNHSGVAERGWWGDYLDPNTFLDPFTSGPSIIGSGWSDARFDIMLRQANAAGDPALRMDKLAECERFLMKAMPILPLYQNVQVSLQKPYVRGLPPGQVDAVSFKYAWIDIELEAGKELASYASICSAPPADHGAHDPDRAHHHLHHGATGTRQPFLQPAPVYHRKLKPT